jgi:hypothetical protein
VTSAIGEVRPRRALASNAQLSRQRCVQPVAVDPSDRGDHRLLDLAGHFTTDGWPHRGAAAATVLDLQRDARSRTAGGVKAASHHQVRFLERQSKRAAAGFLFLHVFVCVRHRFQGTNHFAIFSFYDYAS